MSSTSEEIIKSCEAIITRKLVDAEFTKCRVRDICQDLNLWGCHRAICTNDEFWDILVRLHKLGQE